MVSRFPRARFPCGGPTAGWPTSTFAYRDLGLGIEVDGNVAHATPSQRAADNTRGNAIALRDIRLLRFTYEQVTYEPEMVAHRPFAPPLQARRA